MTSKELATELHRSIFEYYKVSVPNSTPEQWVLLTIDRVKGLIALIIEMKMDDVARYVHSITEEYHKLAEYHRRFGIVQPETKGTGGRYLP